MSSPIKALIVDHDDLFCKTVRSWLEGTDGVTAVGEARDEQEAIELASGLEPDVILVDVDTVRSNGLQAVTRIRELCPDVKIIMLSNNGQERLVLDAFRRGAQGYLVKETSKPSEFVEAIRAVSRGESILSPGLAGWILDEVTRKRSVKG